MDRNLEIESLAEGLNWNGIQHCKGRKSLCSHFQTILKSCCGVDDYHVTIVKPMFYLHSRFHFAAAGNICAFCHAVTDGPNVIVSPV